MGSPSGLWTSVSGGLAQSQNADIIANNLANANTVGFKKDTPTFKEYLTVNERPVSPNVDIPRTIFKESDFFHLNGQEHALVNLDRVHTDHTQSALKLTNSPLDLAIDGNGFFAVKTPSGLAFTRAGDFKVDGQGRVVTSGGHPLLAVGAPPEELKAEPGREPAAFNPFTQPLTPPPGKPPALQELNVSDVIASGRKITISEDGKVYAGDEQVGTLAIAEFVDPRLLQKTTTTLYANPNAANVPKLAQNETKVKQGFLEMSNVNSVTELMELLKANRLFESNMRAIRTYNEMAGKEANEVGKL